jgi:GNAT superfamily N-acetyltransferase
VSTSRLRPTAAEDALAITALMKNLKEWFDLDVWDQVATDCELCEGLAAMGDTGEMTGFVLWLREGDSCHIKWLGVVKELHRHGIGRRLINGMVERVREHGVTRITVDTLAPTYEYEPLARTRAFYEACGFRLDRIEPQRWQSPGGGEHALPDKAVYVLDLYG